MAFDKEIIVPNFRGVPRVRERIEREREDDLTPAQHERAYKHAREHRISLSAAIKELFDI